MKLRHWLLIGFFCLAGGIIFWLWREGVISAGIALLGGLLSIFGTGTTVHKEQVEKKKEDVDRLIEKMREKDREIERIRRRHDEEVKQVEKEYRDAGLGELIDSANERERKRADMDK
jgi:hypothetical protein